MAFFIPRTKRGYDMFEVVSALQKAIRRGDARMSGYWAVELHESGYREYLWKRLLVISAEDCWGILTQEIAALYLADDKVNKGRDTNGEKKPTRVFVAKAALLLAQAKKSRDADHLTNLVYDRTDAKDAAIMADLDAARAEAVPIPPEALDMHTRTGRKRGLEKTPETIAAWIIREHDALKPRQKGLFDDEVDKLRASK